MLNEVYFQTSLISKHERHEAFSSTLDYSFWMGFQPKNVILTNLLSNWDVAWKKPKLDFLSKIINFEAHYILMNQTIVISLLFGHMARVFMLSNIWKYFKISDLSDLVKSEKF